MSFSAEVDAFCSHASQAIEAHCRSVALILVGMVIERTPVLKGRLRGDWRTNVASPNYETRPVSAEQLQAYGSRPEAEWQALAGRLRKVAEEEADKAIGEWDAASATPLYITNNLPYAKRIEEEGYSKTKAPEGMVRVSVAEIQAKLSGGLD